MKKRITHRALSLILALASIKTSVAQPAGSANRLVPVANGWAANSINTVVFRKNSITSFRDTQFIAFYNEEGYVTLGKRKTGSKKWELKTTSRKGNVKDAHNSISIITDGEGFLHMAWDHHNNPLRYCKSTAPGSLELTENLPMTGKLESRVSYPEFYRLPNGDLLFLYRDGASGQGNLVINRYDRRSGSWKQLHHNLIDGERKRNAYWQATIDNAGRFHLSWTWRESPDVASNHDICYAYSDDGAQTWKRSDGRPYQLPITAATAELAWQVAPGSELINQTSMAVDSRGQPLIASYWRDSGTAIPQYRIVYRDQGKWALATTRFRRMAFTLSGMGTKRIPISRPQLITWKEGAGTPVAIIFRDEERGSKVSVACTSNMASDQWTLLDLTSFSVGSWEPTFDTQLWMTHKSLHLFVQHVSQADGEGPSNTGPQQVQVLEWKPSVRKKR